jgi:uncharacterized protein YjbJ (UPF0337 family)
MVSAVGDGGEGIAADAGERTDGLRTEERDELRRLRREVRQLREERATGAARGEVERGDPGDPPRVACPASTPNSQTVATWVSRKSDLSRPARTVNLSSHQSRTVGSTPQGGSIMASGKSDELKGRVKEAAGALTGDKKLKREGKADQAVGKIKQKVEKVIDKVRGRRS